MCDVSRNVFCCTNETNVQEASFDSLRNNIVNQKQLSQEHNESFGAMYRIYKNVEFNTPGKKSSLPVCKRVETFDEDEMKKLIEFERGWTQQEKQQFGETSELK